MTISRQVGAKYISYHPRTQESNLDCTQEKRKEKKTSAPYSTRTHRKAFVWQRVSTRIKQSCDEMDLSTKMLRTQWMQQYSWFASRHEFQTRARRAHIYRCQTSSPVIIVTNILQPVCLRSMQVFQQDVFVQRKTMLDIQWVKVAANSR